MKELFVLFLVALLIVPPIIGIRRGRRVLRQARPPESGGEDKGKGEKDDGA